MTVLLVTVDFGGRVWPDASTVRRTVLLTVGRGGVVLMVTVTGGIEDAELLCIEVVEVLWLCRMPASSDAIMPAAWVELTKVELDEELLLLLLLEEEVKDWL